jgi:diaminohydroxyphosphoribosylaminopyrimidine deaminase/5-amino-6-(5-phosphoribosylamino)uracil reductase
VVASQFDIECMSRALELAQQGEGHVEPNPMVGCVIARQHAVVSEGWHRRFGDAHAEVDALRHLDGSAQDCTVYVTLEPCCHTGKTTPCTEALVRARATRVVVAMQDPDCRVCGRGIQQLRDAGVDVEVGLLAREAARLIAPYVCRTTLGRPWVIAKWAMSWDGRIATASGDSQWISNATSRKLVHAIRGRVDAVAVGHGTVLADDPLLIARPAGPRTAARVVFDSGAQLSIHSQLVQTIAQAPVWVMASTDAEPEQVRRLRAAGCDVLQLDGSHTDRVTTALGELADRRVTNLLIEGGGVLLGAIHDAGYIDEVHVFLGQKIIGGRDAPGPLGGDGIDRLVDGGQLVDVRVEVLDGDVYLSGRRRRQM